MATYVAFLRGINIGGNNKVAMSELRSLCEELGHRDVRTHIQSGNVVLRSPRRSGRRVESELEAALSDRFGRDITVVVRTPEQLRATLDANPFEVDALNPSHLLIAFLKNAPAVPLPDLDGFGRERAALVGQDLYLHYVDGVGRSKLTNAALERLLGVRATARNWNTVNKMLALAESPTG